MNRHDKRSTRRPFRLVGVWLTSALLAFGAVAACGPTDPPPGKTKDVSTTKKDTGTEEETSTGNCTDPCSTEGQRICTGERQIKRCERKDGCLQLVDYLKCPSYKLCEGGTCVDKDAECTNRCTPGDQQRCDSEGKLVRCDDFDDDGCFEWGDPRECATGRTCDSQAGKCVKVQCSGNCSTGEKKCEGELIRTCERTANDCLEFSAAEPCPEGETCMNGKCQKQTSCNDECSKGVCRSNGGVRKCKDIDSDGCKELAGATMCGSGKECRDGKCVSSSTCKDECPKGEKICVGNRIAECKDHDGDGCVEFNQPKQCPSGGTCKRTMNSAKCGTPQMTGKVVINEFLYDPVGKEQRGTPPNVSSPTFIELAGPAGFKIDGYKIELVNGSNGNNYGTVTLPSGAKLDGSGRAVICMKKPSKYFTSTATSLTNVYKLLTPYQSGVDALQNGPDNIILKDKSGSVSDAVGYGFFPLNSPNFKGEKDAAIPTSSGRSLGRIDKKDTDSNLKDFDSFYPTPGLENSDLLINEVYVNQPGFDDKKSTFVEIAAPIPNWEDLPLDGYRLHAINGYNGKDYIPQNGNGVSMFGHKLNSGNTSDGYFVICNKKAKSSLPCDLKYKGTDFQNGPDNFVLKRYGIEIDAIGYGSFSSSSNFVGEGTEVGYSYSDAGKSLSRWPLPNLFYDFDNNLIDFWKTQPTPGKKNKKP